MEMQKTEKPLFDNFYEQYYNQVYWYILKKINHREEAQDITSDVFCACFKHWDKFDMEKSSLKTWLFVIVNNKLKNYYRDRKISVPFDDNVKETLVETDGYISKAIFIDEYRDILAEAISSLPEKNQLLVVLKFFGEKQSDEIAEIMGMTAVNVRVLLSRTLKKINDYLVSVGWNGEC